MHASKGMGCYDLKLKEAWSICVETRNKRELMVLDITPHANRGDTTTEMWITFCNYHDKYSVTLSKVHPQKECPLWGHVLGSGHSSVVERWTHDWKVLGSIPGRSGGRLFFFRVIFLYCRLFWYLFFHSFAAVAHKRSQSFCQKCKWQVTG